MHTFSLPPLLPRHRQRLSNRRGLDDAEDQPHDASRISASTAATTLFAASSSINRVLARFPQLPPDVAAVLRNSASNVMAVAVTLADGKLGKG